VAADVYNAATELGLLCVYPQGNTDVYLHCDVLVVFCVGDMTRELEHVIEKAMDLKLPTWLYYPDGKEERVA
jgi:hypothetical protein